MLKNSKELGYNTACIGKWHLGHREAYLPTNNGFDYYFGIPYSNDMDRVSELGWWEYWKQPDSLISTEDFNVPLMRNTEIIERPANQYTITKRYSEEAVSFIKRSDGQPFFIYLAHSMPHIPLFASEAFLGRSRRGLYGDVVEEIDHGIGMILRTLIEKGLDKNTVVVFTSDNGPWLPFKKNGGSAGLLKAGKGTTWEGGMRVPGIFWGADIIKPGVRYDIGSTMDLYPTFISMAGGAVADDRIVDGIDISQTLRSGKPSSRKTLFYYRGPDLYALRYGNYKAHYITEGAYGEFEEKEIHNPPLLFNLSEDPSESTNIAGHHPGILEEIQSVLERHKANLREADDQLEARDKRP